MKWIWRLLNLLATGFYGLGLAAVGAFWTNTRIIGVRDSEIKEPLIVAGIMAWPLAGAIDLLSGGGPLRFAGSVLMSGGGRFRRIWRVFFTLVGARYFVQQVYANTHRAGLPGNVKLVKSERYDFRNQVAREAGARKSGILSRVNEIYRLEVNTYEIRVDNLPPEFHDFTIAQFSDLHYGEFNPEAYVRCCVRRLLNLQPDLAALTGDFQHYAPDIRGAARLLEPIGKWSRRERGGHGAFAVLGNHDTWNSAVDVTQALRNAGIEVLNNRHVTLCRGATSLHIAGVADLWSLRADLDLALHGIPDGAPVVLLCHVPDMFPQAAKRGVLLQLSGHLHGGQIRLPFAGAMLSPSRFNRRYIEGFHHAGNSLLYTVRGLGGHPPIRLNCLPEIAVFVLLSSHNS